MISKPIFVWRFVSKKVPLKRKSFSHSLCDVFIYDTFTSGTWCFPNSPSRHRFWVRLQLRPPAEPMFGIGIGVGRLAVNVFGVCKLILAFELIQFKFTSGFVRITGTISPPNTHTHTQIYIYMCINIYIYMSKRGLVAEVVKRKTKANKNKSSAEQAKMQMMITIMMANNKRGSRNPV